MVLLRSRLAARFRIDGPSKRQITNVAYVASTINLQSVTKVAFDNVIRTV